MIMILVSLINVILEFKIVYINYHNSQYHTHTMYIFYEICSIFFYRNNINVEFIRN